MSLSDFLIQKLDEALASRTSDAERDDFLAYANTSWKRRYGRFIQTRGKSEDLNPHPIYGPMTAFDFAIILSQISMLRGQSMKEAA